MTNDELTIALRRYYAKHGIQAGAAFNCAHRTECSRGAPRFSTALEPHIGMTFGIDVPRLVFVSLDSGSGLSDPTLERRTLAVRGSWRAQGRDKSKHWYRTCEIAQRVLAPFDPAIDTMAVEDMIEFFAHLNSARCCQNNPGHSQASQILFDNCRQYLKTELELIAPDVLITQGNQARAAITQHFPPHSSYLAPWSERDRYSILAIGPRLCLWYHTYHPRCYGRFNRQRRDAIMPPSALSATVVHFLEQREAGAFAA